MAHVLEVDEVDDDLGRLAVCNLAHDAHVFGASALIHVELIHVVQLVLGLVLCGRIVIVGDDAAVRLTALRDKLGEEVRDLLCVLVESRHGESLCHGRKRTNLLVVVDLA